MNCPKHHKKMTFVRRLGDVRYFRCFQGCLKVVYDDGKRVFFPNNKIVNLPIGAIE